MEENQEIIIKTIGNKKYEEEIQVLKKMKAIEDKKVFSNIFKAM